MPSWASPGAVTYLAATSMAIVLPAVVLVEWARQRPVVRGRVIAASWITVLQEGHSARNVGQLTASLCTPVRDDAFVDWLSGHAPNTLPVLVRANVENLPYSESYEYGAHGPEIRLGVYPVVVRDRGAVAGAEGGRH